MYHSSRTVWSPAVAVLLGVALLFAGRSAAQSPLFESGPIAEDQVPQAIRQAVASPGRPAEDKALDAGRKPDQVMAFFGIKPGMKVADLFAGTGYTTELLSRIVGPTGKVYSQNPNFEPRLKRLEEAWRARLKKPELSNVVPVSADFNSDNLLPVPFGSLDAVVINLNYHDLVWRGVDRDKLNAAIFRYLKPGGIYGIVDSSAQPGSGTRDVKTLHRIDEQVVIRDVERAGFKLAAASSVLRNPADDRTWLVFEHRGTQDRFVLKFIKPKT